MTELSWLLSSSRFPVKSEYFSDSLFRESLSQAMCLLSPSFPRHIDSATVLLIRPDALCLGVANELIEAVRGLGFLPVAYFWRPIGRIEMHYLWRYPFSHASLDRIKVLEVILGLSESLLVILSRQDRRGSVSASVELSIRKGSSLRERRHEDDLRSIVQSPNRILSLFHTSDESIDVVRELGILLEREDRRMAYEAIRKGVNQQDTFVSLLREINEVQPRLRRAVRCTHVDDLDSVQIKRGSGESSSADGIWSETVIDTQCVGCRWRFALVGSTKVVANDPRAPANPLGSFRRAWTDGDSK